MTPRVRENRKVLEMAYGRILEAIEEKRAIIPAAEWLVDNFHVVRTQLKDIRDHLPLEYYRELPKNAEGPLAGYPRVYGIAWAFVAHTDSRFDPELLRLFVAAYQKVQTLTIGELWAIPITLRWVLIENLRRLSVQVVGALGARHEADLIADSLLGVGETQVSKVEDVIHSLQTRPILRSFAVQLLQRLRFQEARVGALLKFLDEKVAAEGQVIETWVTNEHNSHSMANVTARNIITSARLISAFDWSDFFEQSSLVDQILVEGSDFGSMDFATRNRYRNRIEKLSRNSKYSEIEITRAVVSEPGYHLIGEGKIAFEKSIGFRMNLRSKILRWYLQNGTFIYLGAIFLFTFLMTFEIASHSTNGISNDLQKFVIWFLVALISSEIVIAFINRWTLSFLGPKHLPRLNFEKGISEKHKTFIVVPTMFTQESKIKEQLEQLEIHFLSNQDENIYLALLTDFTDFSNEHSEKDDGLLALAMRELILLNDRYPRKADQHPRFSIYHRRRVFNPQEKCWMGWERKRGKLHEFNRLLLGAKDTTFRPCFDSEISVPKDIRYVITLDADTKMPRGSAHQLVGAMAHPLNQSKFDETKGRVVSGYGILQPRITPFLAHAQDRTIFRKLSASRSGIDPYASAVSDIYQDLFGEGSYTGKGIYDLANFELATKNQIPENRVLSHDLLEGNFVRCGFLSDVEFIEDFPSHTGVAALRSHRWIRGDWQLLPWIFGSSGQSISLIGRWKMFDNLRRSLIAPASVLLFFITGILSGLNPWPLFGLLAFSLFIPSLITLWADLWPWQHKNSLFQHLSYAYEEFKVGIKRTFLDLVLLPHNAWISLDAIFRVFYRLYISHNNLLEWTTAAQAKDSSDLNLPSFIRSMQGVLILTSIGFLIFLIFKPTAVYFMFPVLFLWLSSPFLARYFSQAPKVRIARPLQSSDVFLLRSTARQIWHFFATFVGKEENHLPPDNYQEDPNPVIAHRSSPTNFGLYLLSILAAKDFGWIGISESIERLEASFQSLLKLPRYKGHFYNWYNTLDLNPLEPRYISSVDNGNMTAHLFVVAQFCLEVLKTPLEVFTSSRGSLDTFLLLEEELNKYKTKHLEPGEDFRRIRDIFLNLKTRFQFSFSSIENRNQHWENLRKQSDLLLKQVRSFAGDPVQTEKTGILAWSQALQNDIQSSAKDQLFFLSWSDFESESLTQDFSSEALLWWETLRGKLRQSPPLEELEAHCTQILNEIIFYKKRKKSGEPYLPQFFNSLSDRLKETILQSKDLVQKIKWIEATSRQLIREMDFNLLYDSSRKLFSIGLRVSENQLDPSFYDLLASEARLTSFIAIAKGDVPVSHWFHLNRNLISLGQGTALVSWSGSMFEYLMPNLVMRSPEGSLIDDTCRQVIRRQIEYGEEQGLPWGMSESAYNKRDLNLTYQYSGFGVPDLGLRSGLGGDSVVAPYASLLAALYEPKAAVENLISLKRQGALGFYGFYDAVDYTPIRLPAGRNKVVVKTYMAHHQGMGLVALSNIFNKSLMQGRFHSDPFVQATELLLQERTPLTIGTLPIPDKSIQVKIVKEPIEVVSRRYQSVNRQIPTTKLLSNGDYTTMLTAAGSGFSRVHDLAVTRWREDVTRDHYGYFFYIKDCESKNVWSAGYQPICKEAQLYEVTFSEDRCHIIREDDQIKTELEIIVSSEENAEVRKLTLTNLSLFSREIEVTSYAEVVLNSHEADVAHPAFSNLFVETKFNLELSALIASRRPRSHKEKQLWMTHVLCPDRQSTGLIQFETDRSLFIGRGRSVKNPISIFEKEKLSGTVGSVLDPIVSLRTRVRIEAGASAQFIFSMGVAESYEAIEIMAEKFSDPSVFERTKELAWTQSQVKMHHLGIEIDEAHLFQKLATRLLYSDPSLRPPSDVLAKNIKDLSSLWALGISGDHPILLVRIDDIEDRNLIRQLLKAQIYFATKGFISDLIILNVKENSYAQDLQIALENMAQAAHMPSGLSFTSGKVFVLRGDLTSAADLILLSSEARAILSIQHGSLSDQVKRTRMQTLTAKKWITSDLKSYSNLKIPKLEFFNGYGGFSSDQSNEYVIVLKGRELPPAPWINVISNSKFGFQVSESGSGYTWSENSRENQLSPWSNDPVCDTPGEVIYIRDRDSEVVWGPTALPIRLPGKVYITSHGQGYSRFETLAYGIFSELKQFVLVDQTVKVSHLILQNRSRDLRRLSVTSYVEWVLGFSRSRMAPTTITEYDQETQALFAFNPRNTEHGKKIAFHALIQKQTSFTCDRTEFIGRNSSLSEPAALMSDESLQGAEGGGLDPCAALQSQITLKPGEKIELIFVLGQASDRMAAQSSVKFLRKMDFHLEFERVRLHWQELLGKIQVETPDRSFDLVINRWYLYQTIVCRLWARAAFYQVGGAYGFRDQLQDVMALLMTNPKMARQHIILAASRQFLEGDVQHWWHPPFGRGVRTHFSDDLLWLPYVVSSYIRVTEDFSILEESIAFIEGPALKPEEESSYYTPKVSNKKASLYEHCALTLDYSLKTGVHGLPLMGGGDWNDGMNQVGSGGQGESVWLAWFLIVNFNDFSNHADGRGESGRSQIWREQAKELIAAVEKNAWDGAWYKRAFFDDGTPLGTAEADECRIDSLAQTWAIISGAALPDRGRKAIDSVYEHLVKPETELILLFTPPFNQTALDPGYIKGYLPGVRENGGQYTHAASWLVIASALLGEGKKAFELFSFLNPIHHSDHFAGANHYKVEPYVLAGDIYSEPPNAGRGGWSWYTGAAGWMYRAGLEYILGFQIRGNVLELKPCIPPGWRKFKIRYQFGESSYLFQIEMSRPFDKIIDSKKINLVDDGKLHEINLVF